MLSFLPSAYRAPALCAILYIAFALVAALAAPARGAERSGDGGPPVGLLLHAPDDPQHRTPAPAVAGTADIEVSGITGRVTVRQEFLNPDRAWVEGVYVFPLPEDAAIDQMRLRVDGRVVEGVIAERQAARQTFEEAAQSGRRASLLEQERPNLFTMSVTNIPPRSRIEVEIGYQQAVAFQDGRYTIRFPMAVTPRYIPAPAGPFGASDGAAPGMPPPPDAGRLKFPVLDPDGPRSNPMAIRVLLEPGLPLATLESRSHKLMVRAPEDGRYEVTLDAGAVPADRDFVLDWTLEAAARPRPALFVEKKDGAAYLLALIVPPAAAPEPKAVRRPREAILVIDTSGSMHGESIRQARDALLFALDRLHPGDRFNIVAFASRPVRLFETSRPADGASLDAARSFVRGLRAAGGTEIGLALEAALGGVPDDPGPGRLRQVVLLTDGAVGNEPEVLTRLGRTIGASRLFTVAIGSAPNGHFMREAARIGRGAMLPIGDVGAVRRRMTELFAKLENPALTDIAAHFPQPPATEANPTPIPDLYRGEPIVLTARLPEAAGELLLTGKADDGTWSVRAALAEARPGAGIAKLWARGKVDRETGRLRAGADPAAVRKAVLEVALAHGLLTSYTSLVAVDQALARPDEETLARRPLPADPPAGWTPPPAMQQDMLRRSAARATPAVHAPAPATAPTVSIGAPTATPAQLYALVGALALLAALLLWVSHRRFRQ